MPRLLILACSQRKRSDAALLAAIERYEGPAFRVLKRYRRLTQDGDLMVYILSAKFGLISTKKLIPLYDQRITAKRSGAVQASVAAAVQAAIQRHQPSEIFICAGKTYLRALGCVVANDSRVSVARGGQGVKLAALKAWLYQR
jgi:hypothetical protein